MRIALVLLALAACGKKAETSAPSIRDSIIAAWKTGGLAPSAFTAATVPVGKDCATGTVNGVDVLVCTYATDAEAKTAEAAGYTWVGDTTGMVQVRGPSLIAAADRKKADVQGKTINQLMKLAQK
jgi:hypothetical protein